MFKCKYSKRKVLQTKLPDNSQSVSTIQSFFARDLRLYISLEMESWKWKIFGNGINISHFFSTSWHCLQNEIGRPNLNGGVCINLNCDAHANRDAPFPDHHRRIERERERERKRETKVVGASPSRPLPGYMMAQELLYSSSTSDWTTRLESRPVIWSSFFSSTENSTEPPVGGRCCRKNSSQDCWQKKSIAIIIYNKYLVKNIDNENKLQTVKIL